MMSWTALREKGSLRIHPSPTARLEFLVNHGFAHKLERMNAFVACAHPGEEHRPVFLICSACNAVAEDAAAGVGAALGQAAGAVWVRDRQHCD